MRKLILRSGTLLGAALLICGCNAYQPTKNVWKGTKGLWNTYVSPPASVDYGDKGDLAPEAVALSRAIMGIDIELGKLERVMQNADKPPTQEWLSNLFASFPWLNGFAGVKYDGTILGQEPADSLKQLDFIPLLYEDKKQNSRALRADVQPGPLGPEVMLATPLYDGVDFLGIVVAYFDMRSLMRFSDKANDIVALAPGALLWPGKYEFAATPLAGVDWTKVVRESTSGTCSNSTGTFFYMVRYLGNLPLVFATPASGAFPEGNGGLEQGAAFFPQEREKLPPPPMPERRSAKAGPEFEKPEPEEPVMAEGPEPPQRMPEASDRNVIPAGSRESVLLKGGRAPAGRQIQERQLEGENIEVIRTPERRTRPEQPPLELMPEPEGPTLPGGRPSPFGPREETAKPAEGGRILPGGRPSPFGPRQESPVETPAQQPETAQPPAPAQQPAPAQPAAPDAAQAGGHITGLEGIALPKASSQTETKAPESKPEAAPQPPAAPVEPQASTPQADEAGNQVKVDAPKPAERPSTLPGGRPSPFGPRN